MYVLKEYTIEQLSHLVNRVQIRMDSIFAGNLLTSRGQSSLSGYQSTSPDFIKSLRAAATFMPPTRSVHVECCSSGLKWLVLSKLSIEP